MRPGREVAAACVGLTRFVKYEKRQDYWHYGTEAILAALKDTSMELRDMQSAFCGNSYGDTGAGHRAVAEIGMTGIPIINIENACSSGSSAFRLAYQSIATELYD